MCSPSKSVFFSGGSPCSPVVHARFVAAVCMSETIADFDIFDLLTSLVDKSLVVANATGDKARFRFLESMRAYAGEIVEHNELGPMARAHANAYLDLAEELEAAWDTTPDAKWKMLAEPELENWRAALRWAFEPYGDLNVAQRLASALRPVWFTMAPSEGLRWVQTGLERRPRRNADPKLRAWNWLLRIFSC